jgi:hypothetical protein
MTERNGSSDPDMRRRLRAGIERDKREEATGILEGNFPWEDHEERRGLPQPALRAVPGSRTAPDPAAELASPETAPARSGGPFQRADLAGALESGVDPPEVLVDGVLLAGSVHSIYSAGGTGKTYMMLYLVSDVVKAGKPVLIFDLENGLRIITERLGQFGIYPRQAEELIHYYPFPSMPFEAAVIGEFEELLDVVQPALVVFDSWVNCLAACGLDENSPVDVTTWSETYPQKARMREQAVLILDHVPKDGTGPRGTGRKRDYVDVLWELRNPQKFDRQKVGRIDLHLRKDRVGWLPHVRTFSVGSGQDGFVFRDSHGTIEPADEAGLTPKERSTLEALEALTGAVEGMEARTSAVGSMGAKNQEWQDEAEAREVAKTTYYAARKRLLNLDLVEEHIDRYFVKAPKNQSSVEFGERSANSTGVSVRSGSGGIPPEPTEPPADGDHPAVFSSALPGSAVGDRGDVEQEDFVIGETCSHCGDSDDGCAFCEEYR